MKTSKTGIQRVKEYVLSNYKQGQKLPLEEQLCCLVGTTRYAVSQALRGLSDDGILDRKPRSGTSMISAFATNTNGRLQTIAFIVDNFEYYTQVVSGIEEVFRAANLAIGLVKSEFDPKLELSHLESLRDKGYAGAIVRLAEHTTSVPILKNLADKGFPMVLIDNEHDSLNVPCVRPDQQNAAYKAVKHLIELGHRRIAHVTMHDSVRQRVKSIARREAGYHQALTEAGIEIRSEYIVQPPIYFSAQEREIPRILAAMAYEPMHQLLCLPEPPTAVTFGYYWLSLSAYRAVHNCRLKIPEDISLLGLEGDGLEVRCLPQPLTTMSDKPRQQGRIAAEIMKKILSGIEVSPETVLLEEELLIRETTAPPKQ